MSRTALRVAWLVCCLAALGIVFLVADLAGLDQTAALVIGSAAIWLLALAVAVSTIARTTMVYDRTVTFGAPRDRVYAAMIDLHATARVVPTVVSVERLAGEPGRVGARWRTRQANGHVYHSEIFAAEPPARLVIRTWSGGPSPGRRSTVMEVERTLTEAPAGTEVHYHQVARLSLLAWLNTRLTWAASVRAALAADECLRAEFQAAGEPP